MLRASYFIDQMLKEIDEGILNLNTIDLSNSTNLDK